MPRRSRGVHLHPVLNAGNRGKRKTQLPTPVDRAHRDQDSYFQAGREVGAAQRRTRALPRGTPNGGRWWRPRYRFGGKEKLISLGTYPDTGLKTARERRDAARKLLESGVDPSETRRAEKARNSQVANGFEAVAREWHATIHVAKVSFGHASRTLIRLEQDVFPWLGRLPIGEIKAPQLLQTMRRVEARGAIETAHRVLQACGQVFRYAIATGRAERDARPPWRTEASARAAHGGDHGSSASRRAVACDRSLQGHADHASGASTRAAGVRPSRRVAKGRVVRVRSRRGSVADSRWTNEADHGQHRELRRRPAQESGRKRLLTRPITTQFRSCQKSRRADATLRTNRGCFSPGS